MNKTLHCVLASEGFRGDRHRGDALSVYQGPQSGCCDMRGIDTDGSRSSFSSSGISNQSIGEDGGFGQAAKPVDLQGSKLRLTYV